MPHMFNTDQVAGGGFLFVLYHRLDLLFGCNVRETIASESVVRLRGTLYTESESYLSESVPSTPPAKPTNNSNPPTVPDSYVPASSRLGVWDLTSCFELKYLKGNMKAAGYIIVFGSKEQNVGSGITNLHAYSDTHR